MKRLSQTEQAKFFSPVCVRVCRTSSSDRANRFTQPLQLHANGFSPAEKEVRGQIPTRDGDTTYLDRNLNPYNVKSNKLTVKTPGKEKPRTQIHRQTCNDTRRLGHASLMPAATLHPLSPTQLGHTSCLYSEGIPGALRRQRAQGFNRANDIGLISATEKNDLTTDRSAH